MEKDQFVAVETEPWWLLQRDVDYLIKELRQKLGSSFGWADPAWYLERDKLAEVYEFALTQPRAVLDELDLATDDERRLRWLGSLVELRTPAERVPAAGASASSSASAKPRAATSDAPPRRPAFGSRAQAGSTTDAPARRPAFGSRAQVAPGDAGNGAGAAATGDAPARRPAFGSRAQAAGAATPDGAPASSAPPGRSAFGSRARAAAGDIPDAGSDSPGGEPAGAMVDQIQQEVSALSTNELSAMAREVDLSPEEVEEMMADPDFARLVAEERARLDRVGA
jgi:hypothetical protein